MLVAAAVLAVAAAPAAQARLLFFGSNGLTYDVGTSALAKQQTGFSRLTGAGMNAIRTELNWAEIQPASASSSDWSGPDAVFGAMPAGVKAIVLFNGSPTWARDGNQASVCGTQSALSCRMPPAESRLADWQRFVVAALKRYGSKIAAVEVWNEPNLATYWMPSVDPARWARLVHATAAAVHTVSWTLPIVSGGLVGGTDNTPTSSIGPMPFLTAAFAAQPGLAADINAYGLHPYPRDACGRYGSSSWAVQLDFTTDACASTGWDVLRLRIMISLYDQGAPIAITEFGLHTRGPYAVDEATQADWLTRAYDWFNAQPDISVLIFHTLYDTPWATSDDEASYGLVDSANRPKPSWTALHNKLAPGA